jgi:hypothetical protein
MDLTDDENALLVHISRFGSDGYPIQKLGRGWAWSYRGIKGPPVIFKTKREAIASFEAYEAILCDKKAGRILMPIVPKELIESLDRYAEHGIPTGDFLKAVLANDLYQAVLRADPENEKRLRDIVVHVVHAMPAECWGSWEKVGAWIEKHKKERAGHGKPA